MCVNCSERRQPLGLCRFPTVVLDDLSSGLGQKSYFLELGLVCVNSINNVGRKWALDMANMRLTNMF